MDMGFIIDDVTLRHGDIPALQNVSCSIPGGSCTLLTGPTGSGKTTFLRLLYADLLPSSGRVVVDGIPTTSMKPPAVRALRRTIGIVQQGCRMVDDYTVHDNVLMALAIHGHGKADANRRCLEVLADLDVSYIRNKFPGQLSEGERHLAALARAIATRPAVLIADEPTGAMDRTTALAVSAGLRTLHEQGITLVLSTHGTALTETFPDARQLALSEGIMTVKEPSAA